MSMGYYGKVLEITLMYTNFVVAIYIMTGLTGLLSLGQGAFITIGAYTAALAVLRLGWDPLAGIAAAICMGALSGFLVGLPTLKLRRDYFLLVTWGFSEMARGFLLWAAQLTGGAMGVAGIPRYAGLPLIAGSLLVFVALIANLKKSDFRRACIAIRDDEVAAEAMGIDVYAHKIKVFVLSAAISSYGGALFAFNIMFIEPNLFDWLESAKLITIVFIAGLNSFSGALVVSLVYYTFGEIFRFASVWRDVILAVMVILVVIFKPNGLFGSWEFSLTGIRTAVGRLAGRGTGGGSKDEAGG
jgi:branched-chain amino acid transport system permease protein